MKSDVPIGLEITMKVGCPNACTYCPQEIFLSRYRGPRAFTMETFRQCLKTVPISRNLTFMGASEPFLNPHTTEMILWAYGRGHGMSISTTLRGITHADIDSLAHIQFTDTIIHVPANDGRMKLDVTDGWIELFEHAIAAWRHHPDFLISVFGIAHDRVRPVWEASGIPIVNFGLHSRTGLIDWLPKQDIVGPLPLCSKRWCGHLLPNGDVIRCCNDYDMSCVWGNLFTDDYMSLFRSERFREYMRACGSQSDDVPCRHCTDWYRQTNAEHKHLSYDNPCP